MGLRGKAPYRKDISLKKSRLLSMLAVSVFLFTALFSMAGSACAASADSLIKDSLALLKEMSGEDDFKSMTDVLDGAHAVAFVPALVKAGFILGGEYGEGLILQRKGGKWYGPSFYNLGGGSLGLQLGAQKISLVLVVNNEKGVKAFLSSKTKLGGDVSVAAGPVGRRAEAATDAQMKASIYSYSMTKGLFAGFSLEGSVISISVKRNSEYWKKSMSAEEALKMPASDKRILPLVKELDRLCRKK